MIEFENRKILDDGTVILNQNAILELIYSGEDINNMFCDSLEDEKEWNIAKVLCDNQTEPGPLFIDAPQYEEIDWFKHWQSTPDYYKNINLSEWCHQKCKTIEEHNRVDEEIAAFESREMINVMLHLIYCVDVWRNNNIFWGVGRGSSVCSFILYLIGINRINPLEYNLDLHEWLKT